jgi:hypothetical protein
MATRREDLDAMRELLWESIVKTVPEKRAPLFARLESVVNEIAKAEAATPKVGDPVDEIAERRAARGAGTAKSRRQADSN